eukprot:Awhi_evm1s14325
MSKIGELEDSLEAYEQKEEIRKRQEIQYQTDRQQWEEQHNIYKKQLQSDLAQQQMRLQHKLEESAEKINILQGITMAKDKEMQEMRDARALEQQMQTTESSMKHKEKEEVNRKEKEELLFEIENLK